MIEIVVTQVAEIGGRTGSRSIGIIRLDEVDPAAEPEMLQPLDGKSLAVVMNGFRKIAADYAKAMEDFGNPAQ